MGTKYKSSDPRMFTVPASDNLLDAFTGNGVWATTEVSMSTQRGVFTFRTVLRDAAVGLPRKQFGVLEESYPNSRAESWEAFWFGHTNKIARMAEDYRRDQQRRDTNRG